MAILTAYLDESRTDEGQRYPVVAGYLAPLEEWMSLSAQWRAVLADEGVTIFHAADCWANQKGSPFEDRQKWTLPKRERLVNRLLAVIEQHVVTSVITVVDNSAFLDVIGDRLSGANKQGSQYELCGWSIAVLLGKFAERSSPFPVSLVFDRGNRYRHKLERGYMAVRTAPYSFIPYLGSISFASDERVVPLQAADLFAWTIARNVDESWGARKEPSVPWAQRAWEGVPRLENFIRRPTLEGLRDRGWGKEIDIKDNDFQAISKLLKGNRGPS